MQDRGRLNTPGQSLFQGSDSIHIDSRINREEEDEEQEDLKRRDGEIKDLLTHAFDDLDNEDDASSIVSSHTQDVSKPINHSEIVNCTIESAIDEEGPTLSQYQNEFGVYTSNKSVNYAINTPYIQQSDVTKEDTVSGTEKKFGVYGQLKMFIDANKESNASSSIAEVPYELPRPPNLANPMSFPYNLRAQINDGYTMLEDYSMTFNTPSNHYMEHNENHNNRYVKSCDRDTRQRNYSEFANTDIESNLNHYDNCYETSPNDQTDNPDVYNATGYSNKEQLEVLYSVRMREIKQLTEEFKQMQIEKEEQLQELSKKLASAQADIEKSNFSEKCSQKALIQAKTEVITLQSQVTSLKEKISLMEETNQHLADELSKAKQSMADFQQKIDVLERVQSLHTNDRTHEKFLMQAQEKHVIELKKMQTQIDILVDKLDEKESDCVTLEHKLTDVRKTHETLMVEKGDNMNQLIQALKKSQEYCRHLMTANNVQEVIEMQNQMKSLKKEKDLLLEAVKKLQQQLEETKINTVHQDSQLATVEEKFNSDQQFESNGMLNKLQNHIDKNSINKLHVELQKSMASQIAKRKEITRLENDLAQKEIELNKMSKISDISQQEAAHYAKRVNELEKQLKTQHIEHTNTASIQIQKLFNHLNNVKKEKEILMRKNQELENKLKEILVIQENNVHKSQRETVTHEENAATDKCDEECVKVLEISAQDERDMQVERVQLTVQLEQTQKELDRVKELYIGVCETKEKLINDHEHEVKMLKETCAALESQIQDLNQVKMDLKLQKKISNKLTHECEIYMKKAIELEKDSNEEKKKRVEYAQKIRNEIAQAKKDALMEIRNAYPEQKIVIPLSEHCSEHSDKIAQLENDCKQLEQKLFVAAGEQRYMADLQAELDDSKIEMAQMEIAFVALKKKHDTIINERNNLLLKVATLEKNIENSEDNRNTHSTDSMDMTAKTALENEKLKEKCDSLLKKTIEYESRISDLELKLAECKKEVQLSLEGNGSANNINSSVSHIAFEKELNKYKKLVSQLIEQLNNVKDGMRSEHSQDKKLEQLNHELVEKESQLEQLNNFEKIKDERDYSVEKLKIQAKQFEQYIKNQRQVLTDLNLFPQITTESIDLQKIREMSMVEIREEMEQKLVQKLRVIEEQHHKKEKFLEENYKDIIRELNLRHSEKTKELQTSFKTQEQIITHMIEAKLEEYRRQSISLKLRIEALEAELKEKDRDVEEKKKVMEQAISKWAVEMQDMEVHQEKMQKEIIQLNDIEDTLKNKVRCLQNQADVFKQKYQSAKKASQKYKDLSEKKEKFLMSECRRIIEGYNKIMNQIQQNFDDIVSTQEKQVDEKLKEFQIQYDEKLYEVRLQMKSKN